MLQAVISQMWSSRYSTKIEVLELLKSTKGKLHLRVVAGGLAPPRNSGTLQRSGGNRGRGGASGRRQRLSQQRLEMRYEKARVFHSKVSVSAKPLPCCSTVVILL